MSTKPGAHAIVMEFRARRPLVRSRLPERAGPPEVGEARREIYRRWCGVAGLASSRGMKTLPTISTSAGSDKADWFMMTSWRTKSRRERCDARAETIGVDLAAGDSAFEDGLHRARISG